MRKLDVEQLSKQMKSAQNPHDSKTMDTSYDEFAKVIHESATVRPEKNHRNGSKENCTYCISS